VVAGKVVATIEGTGTGSLLKEVRTAGAAGTVVVVGGSTAAVLSRGGRGDAPALTGEAGTRGDTAMGATLPPALTTSTAAGGTVRTVGTSSLAALAVGGGGTSTAAGTTA
jgi:hypothetical protein